MVMPPPMVPAPITATCLMSRSGVSLGTSGILLAARSPKNEWRRARAWSPVTRLSKTSRSNLMSASRSSLVAASTQSTQRCGAIRFLRDLASSARALLKASASAGAATFRSRTEGSGRTPATSLAKAMAAGNSSPSTSLSNSFCPGAAASFSDMTEAPVVIICRAVSTPSTRGRRCVPPAPGTMPMLTSGSAICVPLVTKR